MTTRVAFRTAIAAVFGAILAAAVQADETTDADLIEALRGGGHTLYFRHAATDWTQSDQVEAPGDWTSCDGARMRQLSDEGRRTAAAIGTALKALAIPVGPVLSSEYCRAAETARLLDLGPVETTRDIMNLRAADYVGGTEAATTRLRALLATPPPPGTNRVIVAHGNLMRAATGAYAGEAGAAIYAPDPTAEHGFGMTAQVEPGHWEEWAERFGP